MLSPFFRLVLATMGLGPASVLAVALTSTPPEPGRERVQQIAAALATQLGTKWDTQQITEIAAAVAALESIGRTADKKKLEASGASPPASEETLDWLLGKQSAALQRLPTNEDLRTRYRGGEIDLEVLHHLVLWRKNLFDLITEYHASSNPTINRSMMNTRRLASMRTSVDFLSDHLHLQNFWVATNGIWGDEQACTIQLQNYGEQLRQLHLRFVPQLQ